MTLIPIDYNGGQIFVDENAEIEVDDWYMTVRPDYIGKPNQCITKSLSSVTSRLEGSDSIYHTQWTEPEYAKKIVAQSTNLSLPNIPYVEIEEDRYFFSTKPTGLTLSQFLSSLQPKVVSIEVEGIGKYEKMERITQVVQHRRRYSSDLEYKAALEKADKMPLSTYQKDDKTLLKVKYVQYE